MNKNSATIWMNVTTSAFWERPPVGIVRVEQSLSAELSNLYGVQFKKCVWQGDRFIEWLPELKSNDEGSKEVKNQLSNPISALPPIFPILSKKQALMSLAQSILSLMPNKLRPFVNRMLYVLRPKVSQLLLRDSVAKWFLSRLMYNRNKLESINPIKESDCNSEYKIFSEGDVLISIGLDWDHMYYKKFYEMRKHQKIKVVTCCYDLIPVIYPQYCVSDVAGLFTSYFIDIADGSDLILCISKQSEKDLQLMLSRTGAAMPPTQVFPLGDNVPILTNSVISSTVKSICNERFILFVSTIERRKNHEVLYRAYHILSAEGKRDSLPKLVFVGMPGWGVNELMKDMQLDPLTQGLIVCLNHVTDSELRMLYESALFCVFPSLYEGWGLPVGEALSMGKAVIASPRGSLTEVGGELVHYVDPWNPQDWADALYKMSTDSEWRSSFEQRILKVYRQRTWSNAAIVVQSAINQLNIN